MKVMAALLIAIWWAATAMALSVPGEHGGGREHADLESDLRGRRQTEPEELTHPREVGLPG